jgi:catechol 2,3-dioxygenase-like lactoylglutathione lyase family enzyme
MAIRTAVDRIARYSSTMITRLDLIGIPSQDPDRARSFYRDTLGLRPDEHADYEQWAGDTCFGIWEPKKMGMPFVAQKGNPWALGCDDVAATRAELEAKGVEFAGDTFDTGVCHMAFFSDPDGNDLMLHHRYAPYA